MTSALRISSPVIKARVMAVGVGAADKRSVFHKTDADLLELSAGNRINLTEGDL